MGEIRSDVDQALDPLFSVRPRLITESMNHYALR
jgi:hypothetical protein